jgi:hypothetical protein
VLPWHCSTVATYIKLTNSLLFGAIGAGFYAEQHDNPQANHGDEDDDGGRESDVTTTVCK